VNETDSDKIISSVHFDHEIILHKTVFI